MNQLLRSSPLLKLGTEHIIISPGGRPCFPPFITRLISAKETKQAHIIHTSSYVNSIGPILSRLKATGTALRIAVLGGGQSAAECLIDIHRRLESSMIQGHHIDLIIQKSSLKPSDDSPFVNEIFDPKGKLSICSLLKALKLTYNTINSHQRRTTGTMDPQNTLAWHSSRKIRTQITAWSIQ